MKLEEIAVEAAKLSEKERGLLAVRLLEGLAIPADETEVSVRMIEAEGDPSAFISFDQLVDGLSHRFAD